VSELEKLKADWLRMYEALAALRRDYHEHASVRLMCDGAILGLKCSHPHGAYVAPK
jgi:hypothetical protein